MKLSLFSNPQADSGTLTHDQGWSTSGYKDTYKGRPCTSFDIPDGTPFGHGCNIILHKSSKVVINIKGILYLRLPGFEYPWAVDDQTAALEQDDFFFQDEKVCPECPECPEPEPEPTEPLDIIIAAQQKFPLHSQRRLMLREAALNLNVSGVDSGGRGAFGMLKKETGNNCDGISCDIIAAGTGQDQGQWDVLINDTTPAWNGPKVVPDIRIDELIIPVP